MSYNGSGTFVINSAGMPLVPFQRDLSSTFNALTADLATGLSTAITKDGQTTTTALITFAAGISSTLVTDATSISTGSLLTSGGLGVTKAAWIGGLMNVAGAATLQSTLAVTGTSTMAAINASGVITNTAGSNTYGVLIKGGGTDDMIRLGTSTAGSGAIIASTTYTQGALAKLTIDGSAITLGSGGAVTIPGRVTIGDGTGAADLDLNRSSTTSVENAIRWKTNGTDDFYLGSAASGANSDWELYNYGTSSVSLKVARSTGAVSIPASTVEAGLTISRSTDATCAIYLNRSGGANSWGVYRYGSSGSDKFAIGRIGASEDFIISTAGAVTIPGTLALGTSGMTVTGSATSWGYGVAPSVWTNGYLALEVKAKGNSMFSSAQTDNAIGANLYFNNGFKFAGTGYASYYAQDSGSHVWATSSASGTAGNTATMNAVMALSTGGRLNIGASVAYNGNNLLDINGSATADYIATLQNSAASPYGVYLNYSAADPNGTSNFFFHCRGNGTNRVILYSNGGLGNYSANNQNLSDETVKSDFIPMPSFRDEFAAMHGKWTRYKYLDQTHSDYNSGYRAQDIREVFGAKAPELVDWWETETRIEVEDAETGKKSNKMVPIPESERKLAVYNDDLHNIAMSVLSELIIEQNALRADFQSYKAAHP